MLNLTWQIIVLIMCLIGASLLMRLLFKTKPRQTKKELAWTYEAFIIIFGLFFAGFTLYRGITTSYQLPYFLMTLGGVYISVTHVLSKKAGRYA